jgi:glycosyltransferase involved in cell wall biosynthesis
VTNGSGAIAITALGDGTITFSADTYLDDAVTSVGLLDTRTPVTASLYDLIPLLNPDHFFKGNPAYKEFYSQKLSDLEKTTALLAISEHSKREALSCLNLSNTSIEVVSAAIDPAFCQQNVDVCSASDLRRRVGLTRKFVLYTGGSDKHKNLARLVEAWARLAVHYRQAHQLLIVGRMPAAAHAQLSALAFQKGLASDELIVYGQVTDDELLKLIVSATFA